MFRVPSVLCVVGRYGCAIAVAGALLLAFPLDASATAQADTPPAQGDAPADPKPSVEVTISGGTRVYGILYWFRGEELTLKYEVKNTGTVALTAVTVTDSALEAIGTQPNLAPGASASFEKTYSVMARTIHIATVKAQAGDAEVTGTASLTVHASEPAGAVRSDSVTFEQLQDPNVSVVFPPNKSITITGNQTLVVDGRNVTFQRVSATYTTGGDPPKPAASVLVAGQPIWAVTLDPLPAHKTVTINFLFERELTAEETVALAGDMFQAMLLVVLRDRQFANTDTLSEALATEFASTVPKARSYVLANGKPLISEIAHQLAADGYRQINAALNLDKANEIRAALDDLATRLQAETTSPAITALIASVDGLRRAFQSFPDFDQTTDTSERQAAVLREIFGRIDAYAEAMNLLEVGLPGLQSATIANNPALFTVTVSILQGYLTEWKLGTIEIDAYRRAFDRVRATLSFSKEVLSTDTSATVAGFENWIAFDIGAIVVPEVDDIRSLFAVNVYFVATDPDRDPVGWGQRVSFVGGIGLFTLGTESAEVSNIPFFVGGGFRLNRFVRVIAGSLIFEQKLLAAVEPGGDDPVEPTVVGQRLRTEWSVGVSVTVDGFAEIFKAFGRAASSLGGGS